MLAIGLAVQVGLSARALTVSVAEFRLAAAPDSSVLASFIVLNDEPQAVSIAVSVTDWDDGRDGVTHLYPAGSVDRSCSPWLTVDATTFTLAPFDERAVNVVVRVPEGVRGTHWAGFLVRSAPESPQAVSIADVAISSEALVRLFVTIPPAAGDLSVTKLSVVAVDPFRIRVGLANGGDARLPDITGIASVEGQTGAELSFPLPAVSVLPGRSLDVEAELPWRPDEAGIYLVRAVFDFGAEILVAGQIVFRIP